MMLKQKKMGAQMGTDREVMEAAPETIRVFGLVPDSIVDGPGLRYTVFVQGCTHGCPGCHNPESQPSDGGKGYSIESILADIKSDKLVHDVTFSGGEPFEQPEACATLARRLREEGYGIWIYTGYLYEDLLGMIRDNKAIGSLLDCADVLVDGPFVESLRSIELDWCGSSNQRLIDMEKTRATGEVVEWTRPALVYEKPANW